MIRNQFNYNESLDSYEQRSLLPSMTIQGDSFTIQQLVSQMSQGLIPQTQTKIQFPDEVTHDDLDLQSFHNLDVMDKKPFLDDLRHQNETDYQTYLSHVDNVKKSTQKASKGDPTGSPASTATQKGSNEPTE